MKFKPRQKKILAIMGAVIVLLTVGIFFLPHVNPLFANPPPEQPVDITPEDPPVQPHNPLRNPRIAPDPNLAWETNLGGSKNEEVVAVFGQKDFILIFGNTESDDYDFEDKGQGAFLIKLGFDGTPQEYIIYGGILKEVIPKIENSHGIIDGYLLLLNDNNDSVIVEVNTDGKEIRRQVICDRSNTQIVNLYIDFVNSPAAEPYHAVVEITSLTGTELRIYVLGNDLQTVYHRNFVRVPRSLTFLNAYSIQGGFRLYVNSLGSDGTVLTRFNWSKGSTGDFEVLDLALGHQHFIIDYALPSGVVLGRQLTNDVPFLANTAAGFNRPPMYWLSNSHSVSKTYIAMDNQHYFVYAKHFGGLSSMHSFSMNNLSHRRVHNEFEQLTDLYAAQHTQFGMLFCGQINHRISVMNTNGFEQRFDSLNETIHSLIETDSGIILIGTTTAKGVNVGDHFGGTDIWITKMTFR